MWKMIWPILVVVGSNTIYNISAKSTPSNINAFISLAISYLVAMLTSILLFFATSEQKNIFIELSKANWTTYALGLAVLGLETGFIYVYRSGWKISTAHLFASILLACVLLIVGFIVYKESIGLRQIIGVFVCGIGLYLIGR